MSTSSLFDDKLQIYLILKCKSEESILHFRKDIKTNAEYFLLQQNLKKAF